MSNNDYEAVVGLEVHAELSTKTKIFCNCSTEFGSAPNTQVCPICMGLPGTLPVLNEKVVEYAVKAGLALNCSISMDSKNDRKNYFYPDLPKSYQISQFDKPLCNNGYIEIEDDNGNPKKIRILRIHIEEDSGKLNHNEFAGGALVDLNRAGVPLIEIVSEPDIRSSGEADRYLKKLKSILQYIEVSDCKMEEGSYRADVNVSVHKPNEPFGKRHEMKNMNSFKSIQRAIDFEIKDQIRANESGETVYQETMRWDDVSGRTFSMREKEDAQDYRYFPEPDLLELQLKNELLDEVNASDILLPYEKIKEMKSDFGFHKEFINVLINDKEVLDFFYDLVKMGFWPKLVAKWIAGPISAYMTANAVAISELKIDREQLISFFKLAEEGKLIENQLKILMDELLNQWGDLQEIIKEKWFDAPAVSEDEIIEVVKGVLDANPQIVEQYKDGKVTVIGFFVGQVMKQTQWKANPKQIQEIMTRLLSA